MLHERPDKLKLFLQEQHITQAELGRRVRAAHSYISRVMHGKLRVSDAFRWRFALAFGFEKAIAILGTGANGSAAEEGK